MSFFSFSNFPKAEKEYRVAVVVSNFNEDITDKMLEKLMVSLKKCGVRIENIDTLNVSGAFEIPFMTKALQKKEEYDGIVALGAIIRGETPHFDYISAECVRGIMDCNLQGDTPVILGILTCDTEEQAQERIEKSQDFAIALVNQMNLLEEIN